MKRNNAPVKMNGATHAVDTIDDIADHDESSDSGGEACTPPAATGPKLLVSLTAADLPSSPPVLTAWTNRSGG